MWKFTVGAKKHTQDGPNIVHLMKSVGNGRRPVLAIDVGCGDGIIAFEILTRKRATKVIAIDILKDEIHAATSNLAHFINLGTAEVLHRSAQKFFAEKKNHDRFDRFVINPPFFSKGSGRANKRKKDQVARHETSLRLKAWAGGAKKLLKTGGELYFAFPTERLAEAIGELQKKGIEPKELWWLKNDLRGRRFFMRAVRGARPGLIVHFDF